MDEKNKNSGDELISKLEALLFAYGEPMDFKKISKALSAEETNVGQALESLNAEYKKANRGLKLIINENKAQIVTKPEHKGVIENLIKEELNESLTPAALETLSVVSYAGPISRSVIDYIRGVNSSFILRALLLRGLIERAPDPHRQNAFIYKASFDLLKHLGLSEISDLPEYEKYREIVDKLKSAS